MIWLLRDDIVEIAVAVILLQLARGLLQLACEYFCRLGAAVIL